ncbi:hypothetical protein EOL73_03060 [Candidatus Saccharibacteria bacterium]|nr:hypothetical protein [Candidatus Saccharibacteria bacterium]NCU40709.1 hypothetical protein [Candidatus Saccharibacteria bacterium]
MNLNDVGLLLGAIASFVLTVMPRIEDFDVLAAEGISWQREVKNFRNRIFYRSALVVFSVGFLVQYLYSSWIVHKHILDIALELLVAMLLIGIIVAIVTGVSMCLNRGVCIRARYVPRFNDGSGVFNYKNSWVYIIENKSLKKHYYDTTFQLPMNVTEISVQQSGKGILAVDKNTMSISIPEIPPRIKIFVKVEGLAASDVQGTGGDAYLRLEKNKTIHAKTVGPLAFGDY